MTEAELAEIEVSVRTYTPLLYDTLYTPLTRSMLHPCLRSSRRAARSLCSQCRQLYSPHPRPHPRPNTLNALQFLSSSSPARNTTLQTSPVTTTATATEPPDRTPLRKQLKQDAKAAKARKKETEEREKASRQKWELTVGIEIHAQLDTETKLFSREWTFLGINTRRLTRCRCADGIERNAQFQCGTV